MHVIDAAKHGAYNTNDLWFRKAVKFGFGYFLLKILVFFALQLYKIPPQATNT